jgi:virginiamycin B lyase
VKLRIQKCKSKIVTVASILLILMLISQMMSSAQLSYNFRISTKTLASDTELQPLSNPIKSFPIPTSSSGPNAIVAGPNGTMWFTEFTAGKIGEFFISNQTFREFAVPVANSNPDSLAIDQFGTVWFSDYSLGRIWSLNSTSGVFHQFQIPTPNAGPLFVLVDGKHNIWFTEATSYKIAELTYPSYSLTEYPLPNSEDEPLEMILDQNHSTIWISIANRNTQAGAIGSFNITSKQFGEIYSPPFSLQDPVGIVLDKYGNVWVSEHRGSSITEFSPSDSTWRKYPTSLPPACYQVPISAPATLAIDSKGNLWFVEHFANLVGRLNPSTGMLQEFNIPSPCLPYAYSVLNAIDSKGNFWFTNFDGNTINMIPGNVSTGIETTLIQSNVGEIPTVQAGQSVQIEIQVTNVASTSQTLSLNVSSSFSSDGSIPSNEYSFNITGDAIQLESGRSAEVTAKITPDISLASGVYSISIIFAGDNSSTGQTLFLKVTASPLYFFYHVSDYFQYIIIAGVLVLAGFYFSLRRQRRPRQINRFIEAKT